MKSKELGGLATYCFLINSVIGASVLVIPQVFQRAGVLPCFATLVLGGILSWYFARLILAITDKLTQSQVPLLTEHYQQWDLPEIVRELFGRE